MSEYTDNVPIYFNGDFGTGHTNLAWPGEANGQNEIAFYQRVFRGEPVIRFASEEEIRSAYEALTAGGAIVKPLTETPLGGLIAAVTDRNGIRWNLQFDQA